MTDETDGLTRGEIGRALKRIETALDKLTTRVHRLEIVTAVMLVLATGVGTTAGTLLGSMINGGG